MSAATSRQIGGNHYLKLPIQPNQFVAANNWDAFAQNILKYIVRWRDKAGLVDLDKALHYAHLRIELRMEHHTALSDRRRISMVEFIETNKLNPDMHAPLLALERWVISSGISVRYRAEFIAALESYIEAAKGELVPEDSLFP